MKTYNRITSDAGVNVTALYTVYYLKLPKNYNGAREKLPFCQLVYVDRGDMEYTVGENTVVLHSGQVMITPPDTVRRGRLISGARGIVGIISFSCQPDGIEELIMPTEADAEPVILDMPPNNTVLLRELINEGVELLESIYGDPTYKGMRPRSGICGEERAVVMSKLSLLLCQLKLRMHKENSAVDTEKGQGDVHLFGRIKEYLARRVCSSITVGDICREFSISTSRLKRLFRENEDCGAIDYFIGLKIERAKTMMHETQMNVTQVSERLGFSSPHYFSRVFKQRVGTAPSEYRKSIKKNM